MRAIATAVALSIALAGPILAQKETDESRSARYLIMGRIVSPGNPINDEFEISIRPNIDRVAPGQLHDGGRQRLRKLP